MNDKENLQLIIRIWPEIAMTNFGDLHSCYPYEVEHILNIARTEGYQLALQETGKRTTEAIK